VIAKQVKGCDFQRCLDYLLNKEASQIIGGNMTGNDPESLAGEFEQCKPLSRKAKRKVYHVSLSLAPHEKLSEEKWKEIASEYLKGMQFVDNQYVIVGHNDTQHAHIHIVANRTSRNGRMVNDGWDFVKSEKLVRQLEKKYNLEPTVGSKDRKARIATTGETRLRRRTGETSVREYLQNAIDSICTEPQTMPEFIAKVQEMGIETRITAKGDFRGISFKHDGIAFSGTHLGQAYTFPGLQKHQGVSYEQDRDDALLLGCSREFKSPIINDGLPPVSNQQQQVAEAIFAYKAILEEEARVKEKKKKQLEMG